MDTYKSIIVCLLVYNFSWKIKGIKLEVNLNNLLISKGLYAYINKKETRFDHNVVEPFKFTNML